MDRLEVAAIEPAAQQRDDRPRDPLFYWRQKPQWSPPLMGRQTGWRFAGNDTAEVRLQRSSATGCGRLIEMEAKLFLPRWQQWSPRLMNGVTLARIEP